MSLNTAFLLMAQYNGKAIIPLDEVRRDFFSHLTLPKFLRKLSSGDIALPLMPIETSQKCAKGVHLQDLADYLDKRRQMAQREFSRMSGWKKQM
ncbi:pyocin activator PrtN family protein [Mesorhizobium wenxiniae]|uniref:Pyocin activator protein PrtN n=1 Tax=Mesorhizobium wenxiniae TaxID=2014805 RepID=A0A271KD07_9HYPH|nr:pyocin activator PrtN family protein [Mesorhizobium wenxiniae]PAP92915.1 Pyocin activator protein PrtN [Mesorhizobium wenxiniae]